MANRGKGAQGGRGARSDGPRKGATKGSGGKNRSSLTGKGPTPRAENRVGHPAARRARAAAKKSRPRAGGAATRAGTELITGRNAVLEALRGQVPGTTLYVAQFIESDDRVQEALQIGMERGITLQEVPRGELDRIAGPNGVHQGLAMRVPTYSYAHPDDLVSAANDDGDSPLIVALDGVTDPHNLGAVVRSAAAFGAHGVVVPERRSAGMTAGAWKASAGAAARLPVAQATNLTRALAAYQEQGLTVVGLSGDADTDIADLEVAVDPVVLVIGSEGRGLSRLVAERCDLTVRVPIAETTESLNASVAAGVALYEVARRRRAGY